MTGDNHQEPLNPEALTTRIAAILDALGGRTAIAAQRAAPPTPQIHRVNANTTGPDGQPPTDDHAQKDDQPPAESAVFLRADEVFPAASLAKLPIAVELLRRTDLGQFTLTERFDTSAEPRVGGGGVLDYLDPSVQLSLNDLCFMMLAVSDNTAANFLLSLVGMGEVNETLSRLNLTHTRLARLFMDWTARAAHRENVTTAADMFALMSLLRGNALPGARGIREMLAAQQLAEDVLAWLPASAHLAHKSGALDDIFHDVGILTGPGGACVYAVLTADQPAMPEARAAVGRSLRTLWDAWCAG